MKNKKGFVFIETIIMIVVLAASLLILYNSYSSSVSDEKRRLTHDDTSYLYRNYYLLEHILSADNLSSFINANNYLTFIGPESKTTIGGNTIYLYDDNTKRSELESMMDVFHVNAIYIVSSKIITNCYNGSCSVNYGGNALLQRYVERLNVFDADNTNVKYFLVVEYTEKSRNGRVEGCVQRTANCKSFYASLEIPI